MASRVADWLAAAGLSRHARAFAGMPEGQFLGMMMQVRENERARVARKRRRQPR
jgi:hypothetical protein